MPPSMAMFCQLWNPVCDKNIGLVRSAPVAVRRPHKMLPIRAEVRKPIELVAIGDALQPGAVQPDLIDLELAPFRIVPVGGKDERLAIGRPTGREIGDV